jgi:hypothetical protein
MTIMCGDLKGEARAQERYFDALHHAMAINSRQQPAIRDPWAVGTPEPRVVL